MNHLVRACLPWAVCLVLLLSSEALAVALFAPGDPILAIDVLLDSDSSSPAAEGVVNLLDANPGSKYLNFAKENSGFIVTPAVGGPHAVNGFMITTANDSPSRDPASWALYGTNDPIASTNHSLGDKENWTPVDSGTVALPDARNIYGPLVSVNNSTAYTSYRMVFPTLKDTNAGDCDSMQIADIEFYTSASPGVSVLSTLDAILAIDTDAVGSRYPANESPPLCLDNNTSTKYLNFGREGSGLIITPSVGASIATSFQITTANDSESRDPASWEIYGTNDPITSTDNSMGDAENWSLVGSGTVAMPTARFTVGPEVAVSNATAYTSYRMIFLTVRDNTAGDCDSVQYSEIQFFGTVTQVDMPGDANRDGKVDETDASILASNWLKLSGATWSQGDFNDDGAVNDLDASILAANWLPAASAAVPEPSILVLLASLALAGLVRGFRRK